jgi:hypothetical protein
MPLLAGRTVLITVAKVDDNTLRVNVIPHGKADDNPDTHKGIGARMAPLWQASYGLQATLGDPLYLLASGVRSGAVDRLCQRGEPLPGDSPALMAGRPDRFAAEPLASSLLAGERYKESVRSLDPPG